MLNLKYLATVYVWVERVAVLIANLGVNIGVATTGQESAVQAGGIVGIVTTIQIVAAILSHYYSPPAVPVQAVTTPATPSAEAAAQAAGKAV